MKKIRKKKKRDDTVLRWYRVPGIEDVDSICALCQRRTRTIGMVMVFYADDTMATEHEKCHQGLATATYRGLFNNEAIENEGFLLP